MNLECKFHLKFGDLMKKRRSFLVRCLQRHEKKCQINKKTENGSGVDGGASAVVNEDSRDEENDADVSSSEADEI